MKFHLAGWYIAHLYGNISYMDRNITYLVGPCFDCFVSSLHGGRDATLGEASNNWNSWFIQFN